MKKVFFYSLLLASAILLLANGLTDGSMLERWLRNNPASNRVENALETQAMLAI